MSRAAVLVAVGALIGATLLAQTAAAQGDEAEGRRRYKRGQELYSQGRYLDAAKEFEAGYQVAPRPLFLLNIGHAYRRAGELSRAKTAYETLLRLQPDLQQRSEVEQYIRTIDDALQASEPTPDLSKANPNTQPPPSPPPPLVDPTPSSTAPLPVLTLPPPTPTVDERVRYTQTPEQPSGSVFKKPWFWIIIGAAVAGGVAAAVISSRSTTACPGTICIRE
jgi:tetratricopeptide (TPR) repeat protein